LMDLNEATRETISLSVTDLQRNRVILRHELADDLPPVNADRIQLQQVILNLLRNAWDALSTVEDRPREMLIRTESSNGDRVRVSVEDSGVGFTTQAADKLFEAFYTTKNDGMGIGLSISRSIVEAHHGHLWATPNDGPGATFSFAIPCGPNVERTPKLTIPRIQHQAQHESGLVRRKGRNDTKVQCTPFTAWRICSVMEFSCGVVPERALVSVVDDDESVRESLPDLLREFGFAARAFSSAEEFLSSDCIGQTRCLILDLAGMNGLDSTGIKKPCGKDPDNLHHRPEG
jgi:Histidine kinase-, DNA gyrase B-, and HSP90-like ATPase